MSKEPKKKSTVKNQTKICPTCDREFHNRYKWESRGQWDNIVYCSSSCRKKEH